MSTVLVVDDEEMIRVAFAAFLADSGHRGLLAADAQQALAILAGEPVDVAFVDYRLPGTDGLELLAAMRQQYPDTAVVVMTAHGRMDVAIRAMQAGAFEYLAKPLDLERVRDLIDRIQRGRATGGRPAAASVPATDLADTMVGPSAAMQEIFKLVGILTTQEVPVLITGESGVGKELVARAIHDHSARRHQPFVAINCGALPDQLLESELFGFEAGAFTGAERAKPGAIARAGAGTIFLDEVGELPLALQVKLLRVLQDGSYCPLGGTAEVRTPARVIAATNRDLKEAMAQGAFRPDLYYRLHLVHLEIPPLRQRRDDIPALVAHVLARINRETGGRITGVEEAVLQRFQAYHWPGNVRELENMLRRAAALARGEVLTADLFEWDDGRYDDGEAAEDELDRLLAARLEKLLAAGEPHPMERLVAACERSLLQGALARTAGNQSQAARLLGMHRSTFREKCRALGLLSATD